MSTRYILLAPASLLLFSVSSPPLMITLMFKLVLAELLLFCCCDMVTVIFHVKIHRSLHIGASEKEEQTYRTINSWILITSTEKGSPNFQELRPLLDFQEVCQCGFQRLWHLHLQVFCARQQIDTNRKCTGNVG